jgi:hypothetical protein
MNLTATAQDIAGFLDALKGPLPDFLLALGVAIAVIGLVVAIIFLIRKAATSFHIGGK